MTYGRFSNYLMECLKIGCNDNHVVGFFAPDVSQNDARSSESISCLKRLMENKLNITKCVEKAIAAKEGTFRQLPSKLNYEWNALWIFIFK